MAAKKGNQNAIGNSGGRADAETRKKINKIKGLTFDYIEKTFKGDDETFKKQVVLKLIGVIFPREIVGEDGEPIKLGVSLKVDLAKLDYERLLRFTAKKNTAK